MLSRLLLIFTSTVVVASVTASWMYGARYRNDLEAERFLCRTFLVCANDAVREAAHARLWSGGAERMEQAAELFRELLRRNPASPRAWCDLAEAHAQAGNVEKARSCFERGVEQAPNSPPVLMRAANFDYAAGDYQAAMRRMARILALVRAYDAVVFRYYGKMGVTPAEILQAGIPENAGAGQAYFQYLLREGNLSQSHVVWNWLTERGFHNYRLLANYLDLLLKAGEYTRAAEAQARAVKPPPEAWQAGEYVFNPGFEREPLGTQLDWRISPHPGFQILRDSAVADSGAFSLRVKFHGTQNVAFHHVSQRVIVRPGPVEFRARIRTAGVTTDQGVAFRIFDAGRPLALDVRTAPAAGTRDWMSIGKTFTVPARSRLLEIQLVRDRSRQIDSKIAGTVWIDNISLSPRN